jgi:hypothetical protein
VRRLIAVAGAVFLFALTPPAHAATRVPCDLRDLGDAISHANSATGSETLTLARGCIYVFTVASTQAISITDDLVIEGNGATIIRNSGYEFRIMYVDPTATVKIEHLTIMGGHALDGATSGADGSSGGGILNRGHLTLSHVLVEANVAGDGATGFDGGNGGDGGGISNEGTLTLVHSSVRSNISGASADGSHSSGDGGPGGGIANSGTLHLRASRVTRNAVGYAVVGAGGGIYNTGIATISRSTIVSNNATSATPSGNGGGIDNEGTHIVARRSKIKNNTPDNCAPPGSVSHCHN